jgi:phthiodiolone/phenolphthiodiolone dimycocerosates ketoreductase
VDVGIAIGATPPFEAMERRVARFAAAGFRSFWWPDHLVAFHSAELWATGGLATIQPDPHVYADPFVCMARCADAAGDAWLGTCVTDAVRRMPATLLQTAMSLDHVAPGRIVLGLGSGERANYEPYGVQVDSPTTRLEDATRQIRRLLEEPGPDEHGAVVGLRPPPGSPGPRLWLAAHGPRGLDLVGRYADGWLPNFLRHDEWRRARDAIATVATSSGRDPTAITYGLSAQVVIQETRAEARRLLSHPVIKAFALLLPPSRFEEVGAAHPLGGSGLGTLLATLDGDRVLEAAAAVPTEVVEDLFLFGTVDDVVDALRRYKGLDHVVLWDPIALADLGAARAGTRGTTELAARLHDEST